MCTKRVFLLGLAVCLFPTARLPAQRAATATAAVSATGAVTNLILISGGAGYTAPPGIVLGGGGGSNATARASVANGSVAAIQLLNGGSGYTNAPSVGIDPPDSLVTVLGLRRGAALTLAGEIGSTQEVQAVEALGGGQAWTTLKSAVLTNGLLSFQDTNASGQRFYRAVARGGARPATPEGMVWLPPGSFLMGSPLSDPDYIANEGPQAAVRLTQGFFLGRREVSQEEYLSLMGTNPATFVGDGRRPVETVAWKDATNYCARLTQREQAAGRLPATWRYRLPTEAEWEYAARAGGADRFGFSEAAAGGHAWLGDNSQQVTHPAGAQRPNPWGLFDLAGNVAEWCADVYGDYPGGECVDPGGAAAGLARVVRGGSGVAPLAFCRAGARDARSGVDYRDAWVGFRVALAYAQPESVADPVAVGGAVSGKVTLKGSGIPVAGVTVYLVNTNHPVDTNNSQNNRPALVAATTTGQDGQYAFHSVKSGNYALVPLKSDAAGSWRIEHDGISHPPVLALAGESRSVDFLAQDASLFEGDEHLFQLTIYVVNIPANVYFLSMNLDYERRFWIFCFPGYEKKENLSVSGLDRNLGANDPLLDTRGRTVVKFTIANQGYGSFWGAYTLENTYRLTLKDSSGARTERFAVAPITGCPKNAVYTWDYATGDLRGTKHAEDGDVDLAGTQAGDIRMAWMEPGTFTLGSPEGEEDRKADEGPQTKVAFTNGFWISRCEVTRREYLSVTGQDPSFFKSDWNRPVESVTWMEATNFCARLTRQRKDAGRLPQGWRFRLPTEAEWEYACRAGTATRFNYGDDPTFSGLENYAWYSANSGSSSQPVGLKSWSITGWQGNAWGLHDLHGNVREWCQDWHGAYPGGSVTNFPGAATGTGRVERGGGWGSPAVNCRSARRGSAVPDARESDLGFRVVLAPE